MNHDLRVLLGFLLSIVGITLMVWSLATGLPYVLAFFGAEILGAAGWGLIAGNGAECSGTPDE